MKITESITAHVTLKDVETMIRENALKEGYDVVKITPEYEVKRESTDPRDYSTPGIRHIGGFKVDLKRRTVGGNLYDR